jgi:signal transduction histidine kinase
MPVGGLVRAFAAALSLALAPAVTAADTAPAGKNVLVLYSYNRLLPAHIEIDRGLREAIANSPGRNIALFSEFLDRPIFSGPAFEKTIATYLRDKYVGHPPDVIVVVINPALDFLLRHRADLFPAAPVLHVGVDKYYVDSIRTMPPDVVGVPVTFDFSSTIQLALRLHPNARRLVLVTGASTTDRLWESQLRADIARLKPRPEVEFLAGLSTDAVVKRLRELDSRDVLFTPGYFTDGAGRQFTTRISNELMVAASGAPAYGPFSPFVGSGIVGGVMPSFADMGQQAGKDVKALLDSTPPAELRLPASIPAHVNVDWRQLRRWNIDEKNLPPGAEVRFREPSVWESYWREISIMIVVVVLQGLLIARLLFERRQRRQAAVALEASEQRANLAARAAGLSAWIWETDGGRIRTSALPGSPDDLLDSVHPADRQEVRRAVMEALTKDKELNIEYRVLRPGGEVRWISARGRAQKSGERQLIGVSLDITERKRAELQGAQDRASLRHMARVSMLGQLSAAIAHQLNQPLAAILGNAEAAQKMLGRERVDLVELRAICDDIVAEDHRAAEVIRRLRDLYRRGEIRREPCDLNVLVREMVELLRTELMTRHVVAATELAPSIPPIHGDRVQLQQVLLNLVLNAADAMGEAAEDRRIVTVRTELADDRILLSVADHGPGVRDEDMAYIFEGFWSTKPDGMGVGLAISKSIVDAHDGSLSAFNNDGGGAIFRVSLPVQAQA